MTPTNEVSEKIPCVVHLDGRDLPGEYLYTSLSGEWLGVRLQGEAETHEWPCAMVDGPAYWGIAEGQGMWS